MDVLVTLKSDGEVMRRTNLAVIYLYLTAFFAAFA